MTVATSDALEQVIILGQGARRMSAAGLKEEVEACKKGIKGRTSGKRRAAQALSVDHLEEEEAKEMERVRLGKEK